MISPNTEELYRRTFIHIYLYLLNPIHSTLPRFLSIPFVRRQRRFLTRKDVSLPLLDFLRNEDSIVVK